MNEPPDNEGEAETLADDRSGRRSGRDATPAGEPAAPASPQPVAEKAGDVIGPYKLLQQIGEGGFGVVYMAEQTEPVKRRVALKIIKPGMDTKEVIARFDAERQALALMDHPNIAKVLDVGATETGRPFFAMELVKGVSITEYCDTHRLDTRQRLELFRDVCGAVQHAHQKGVIHRDIKPSNILVTHHDTTAVVKVIDFGVAKAISQELTEKTLFTAFGQMIGTLQYMSPEQSEMSGLDVDTRSDIYSLGVVLYELLTGRTPIDPKHLREAGLEEVHRIIREQEPARPSTRLTSLENDEITAIAKAHSEPPEKLSRLVRGDLDWIVMKALDKDRTRRYETATGFAEDIRRYLDDEAVLASPPSSAYRLGKFARRNKAALATASVILATLIAAVGVSTWQAMVATKAREAEAEQREIAESNALEAIAKAREAEENAKVARQAIEDLEFLTTETIRQWGVGKKTEGENNRPPVNFVVRYGKIYPVEKINADADGKIVSVISQNPDFIKWEGNLAVPDEGKGLDTIQHDKAIQEILATLEKINQANASSPDKQLFIVLIVYQDSISTYLEFQKLIYQKGLSSGWRPVAGEDDFRFGIGGGIF